MGMGAEAEPAAFSQARFAALLDALDTGIAFHDRDNRVVFANRAADQILGLAPGELVGLSSRDSDFGTAFDDGAPAPADARPAVVALRTGEAQRDVVVRVTRHDGTTCVVSVNAYPLFEDELPGPSGVVVVFEDITHRRQTEDALERSEKRLSAMLEHSNDVVLVIDGDRRLIYASPSAPRLLGYDHESHVGTRLGDLVHPDDLPRAQHAVVSSIFGDDGGNHGPLSVRVRHADGTWRDIELVWSNRLSDPAIEGIVVNLRDITERRRAEAAERDRELARRQLELFRVRESLTQRLHDAQRLAALGRLAGGIAHDFNNVLGIVLNYASYVERNLDSDSTLQPDIAAIRREAENGADLVRRLLMFSPDRETNRERFDLRELVDATLALLQRPLGDHIAVKHVRAPVGCFVEADRVELDHALVNLVLNARDALVDGGEITVETAARPDGSIVLRVGDNGTGMTNEVLERAFEPFFTTKGPAGGSGLGLASVYGIVERAGGRVHIVSAQGAGTTVTVELPGCDDVTASSEVFVGCDRPGAVVLVVDDEPDACVMTCRILHEAGFSTVAARDAETALEVLAQRRPDVLLTDVVLPGLDGPELAVRAREQFPDLPVVLMSGHRGAVVTRDLPLVTKPFDADTLVRAVAAALGADQARSCGGATMPVRTAMAVASSLE